MLADIQVYLGIMLGLPPRTSEVELAELSPRERLKETMWEESHSRSSVDKFMSFMVLAMVAMPFIFLLLRTAYVVCAGPLRKLVLQPVWSYCKTNELDEQLLYLAAFGCLSLAVRLTPFRSAASGPAVALLVIGSVLAVIAWQKTMNTNEPFRAVPKAGVHASPKELKDVRRAVLKRRLKRQALGAALLVMVTAPLAVVLQCSWLGFGTVLAALSAAVLMLSLPNYGEGSFEEQLERLVTSSGEASLCIAACVALANLALGPFGAQWYLASFSSGACLFGHTSFLASRLTLSSSRWRSTSKDECFRTRQQQFITPLVVCAALGWGADVQALKSASIIFTLAWLALREYEAKNTISHPLYLLVKWVAAASVLFYVATNSGEVLGLLDGKHLYSN